MEIVLLCALGVGGSTIIGAILGFIFKGLSHRFSDIVLAFAAGVMLSSAILALIIPSIESGGRHGIFVNFLCFFGKCFKFFRKSGTMFKIGANIGVFRM